MIPPDATEIRQGLFYFSHASTIELIPPPWRQPPPCSSRLENLLEPPFFFNLFFPFFDASRHAIRPCRCLFASCHLLRRLRSLSCTFYAYYHAHCHVYYHALYHAHLSFCFTTFTWPTAGGTRLRAAFIGDMIPPCPSAPTSCTLFCRRGTLSTPRLT